jgi:hypothetical protein
MIRANLYWKPEHITAKKRGELQSPVIMVLDTLPRPGDEMMVSLLYEEGGYITGEVARVCHVYEPAPVKQTVNIYLRES